MDMEHYHCGWCGKYVAPDEGFYGSTEKHPQRVYCNEPCCMKAEPEMFVISEN